MLCSNVSFQTYTCDIFFAQSWKDDRLKWRQDDNITAKYRLVKILLYVILQVNFCHPKWVSATHLVFLQDASYWMADWDLATRFLLQERQKRHFSDHDYTKSLHLAMEGQNNPIHGEVSSAYINLLNYIYMPTWTSSFRLTLVLSCPMHFKNYPHDTQTCHMQIESSKLMIVLVLFNFKW